MKPSRQDAIESAADLALTQMEQASKMFTDDPQWCAALSALRVALAMKPHKVKPVRIIVETVGGVVNAVHSSIKAKVDVLDWDDYDQSNPEARGTIDRLDAEATALPFTQ